MALKEYEWRGSTWRFEESDAPEGAKPVSKRKSGRPSKAELASQLTNPELAAAIEAKKAAAPADKSAKRPATKSRKGR